MAIIGVVDTTVVIHLIRNEPAALVWIGGFRGSSLAVTSVTWAEIMKGENSKTRRLHARGILELFRLVYLEHADQDFLMQATEQDPGIGINDCLIAAVAYRLGVPLYTHNLADMRRVLPRWKVLQPYKLP